MQILSSPEFEKLLYEKGIAAGISPYQSRLTAVNLDGLTTDEGDIIVRKGSGTHLRLHELGHKVLGSPKIVTSTKEETLGDLVYGEILAEKFAWESKGKPITYRIVLPAIRALNLQGYSAKDSVDMGVEVLTKYEGVPVNSEDKKFLRHWAKRNLLGRKDYYTKY